ncbi:hypothetical protein G7074_18030 [Pedobacter sp. HDW13]|uniref:hypothetical protein n=1 Tax=Pedobacter sp. HDW13 TaxID=2714940 RepID=UPI00140731BB|nr:hypothetical protein [Pedobacter sp. HDW13]QIL40998.1 hypothetical protein G7074_18030 [Pedobacter sp. HDW13]
MAGISTKINLAGLKHSVREIKGQGGKMVKCLVIPIEINNLYQGEKGVYLDLEGFEIRNKVGDSKDTHLVKQSLPKELYNKLTDEQKKAIPLLGSHILWGGGIGDAQINEQNEDDDLPF